MKLSKPITAIIVVMLVLQIFSMYRIQDLSDQVRDQTYQISSLRGEISTQIGGIANTIQEELQQQREVILDADYTVGDVSYDTMAVPITFSVTPKELADDTTVSLIIGTQTFDLVRDGTTFTKEITFETNVTIPQILISVESDGVQHMSDYLYHTPNLFMHTFPTAQGLRLSGSRGLTPATQDKDGTIHLDGDVTADFIASYSGQNRIESVTLYVSMDDTIVHEETVEIQAGSFNDTSIHHPLDITLPFSDEALALVYIVGTDTYGFKHEYYVDVVDLQETKDNQYAEPEWYFYDIFTIYDNNGNTYYTNKGEMDEKIQEYK